jgi:UDP-N-acetylglucosamine--N-acetylmuramyl-(pentapeptide) pyrophosphoryl-undecaprenol N-acetylglucosamine transferase
MEQQRRNVRCLIAAGGTAGHVAPSLAVAEALERRGAQVTFAGSPDRIEARLVPEAGYELDTFRISGLPRRPSPELARALLLAGRAPRACARILEARRPDVVLGGGGYVAGPMVYAAARRKIPTALMEADAHLGLANRLATPFARRVFLSFPIAGRDGSKYRVTGRPIPARSRAVPQGEARDLFGLPDRGPVLLVFGGSLGARVLNELAIEAFGQAGPAVLHLAGTRDYDELRGRVSRPDYRLFAFTEEFGAALGASDLALARAGGSVWELAAAGKPAVLVPGLFATGDHQTKNASYFEQGGGAVVLREDELASAAEVIRSLLDDPGRLAEMSTAMTRLARPDAADEIAEELLVLAS